MKSILLIISLLTFAVFTSHSQKDHGFYGKKGFIQFQTLFNTPFFPNLTSEGVGYERTENGLIQKNDRVNFGYRASIGYAVKRNLSLLVEFGQDFSSAYIDNNSNIQVPDGPFTKTYDITEHESIRLKSNIFMPIIEFGSSKGLLPMGLSHQIGLGVENTSIEDRDYRFLLSNNSSGPDIPEPYANYSDKDKDYPNPINISTMPVVKKVVFMYGLSMRSPISKSVMINYGIKYLLHFGPVQNLNYDPYTINNEVTRAISKHRNYSLINLNLGLTYVF